MKKIRINEDQCSQCGVCVEVCPSGVWIQDSQAVPERLSEAEAFCIRCAHCAAACPQNAIDFEGREFKAKCDTPGDSRTASKKISDLIRTRRSIRNYTDQPVDQSTIAELIDTTRWAPTAKNTQEVCWTVVHDKKKTFELAGLVAEWFRENDVMKPVVDAWDRGQDMILRGAPHVVIAHAPKKAMTPQTDCVIAMTLFDLAAQARNLGTCWAGFLMMAGQKSKAIRQSIGLSPEHKMHGAMMLGHPVHKYRRIPPRESAKIRWVNTAN